MKIIKYGKKVESKELTCEDCKSVLEYTNNDILKYSIEEYYPYLFPDEFILCPVCYCKNIIRHIE